MIIFGTDCLDNCLRIFEIRQRGGGKGMGSTGPTFAEKHPLPGNWGLLSNSCILPVGVISWKQKGLYWGSPFFGIFSEISVETTSTPRNLGHSSIPCLQSRLDGKGSILQ